MLEAAWKKRRAPALAVVAPQLEVVLLPRHVEHRLSSALYCTP
jgi:hypothetical protein